MALSLLLLAAPAASAQAGNVKTNTKILYHNGPVLDFAPNVYFIFYGGWNSGSGYPNDPATQAILTDFVSSIGGSPYFLINSAYPTFYGGTPTGGLFYAASAIDDSYSQGFDLTPLGIQTIVSKQFSSRNFRADPLGIYIVVGTSDISSNATGFCTPNTSPHHGFFHYVDPDPSQGDWWVRYAFIGNAQRCPTSAAPQFFNGSAQLPTPNANLAGDAMASSVAHVLDGLVTNPMGDGWFDRYGLENAAKCQGTFGQTYTTTNGARANMHRGQRDFLIQQNWVNARKGYCALALPTP